MILGDLQDMGTSDSRRFQDKLGIITDSFEKNLYCTDLQGIFNFETTNSNGDEIGIKHLEGTLYIYPAKKKESSLQLRQNSQAMNQNHLVLKIVLVVLLIVCLILAMMIIVPKNRHSNMSAVLSDI